MTYSNEQKAAILAAGRKALADAEASLNDGYVPVQWPPVEDRVAKWKREADEQAARFARERAAGFPLTEWEQQHLAITLAQQKDFNRKLLAHVVADLREEYSKEFDAFTTELAKRLGDLFADELGPLLAEALEERERRQVRATNNNNNRELSDGEVIDLPAWPLVRKRRA
jgi:hypothetical protein